MNVVVEFVSSTLAVLDIASPCSWKSKSEPEIPGKGKFVESPSLDISEETWSLATSGSHLISNHTTSANFTGLTHALVPALPNTLSLMHTVTG